MIASGAFLAGRGGGPIARATPPGPSPIPTVPVVSEPGNVDAGAVLEGSLNGVSFLYPKQLPEGLELKSVSVSPLGCCPGSPDSLDAFLATYLSADGKQMLAVSSLRVVGGPTPPTTAQRSDMNATVHGFPARLGQFGSAWQLTWDEDGGVFSVYAPAELSESQVTAFAQTVIPDKTTAAFTASPPAGYAVRYRGEAVVPPAWSVTLNFESETAQVSVAIQQLSEAARAGQELRAKFGSPGFKRVKIGELDALVFGGSQTVAVIWNVALDVGVNLQTDGLGEKSALVFARSLQPVDEANFRATVGSKLSIESGSRFPLPGGPSPGTLITTAK